MEDIEKLVKTIVGVPDDVPSRIIVKDNIGGKAIVLIDDKLLCSLYHNDNIPTVDIYEYKETKIGMVE